jgi:hypothetical protein
MQCNAGNYIRLSPAQFLMYDYVPISLSSLFVSRFPFLSLSMYRYAATLRGSTSACIQPRFPAPGLHKRKRGFSSGVGRHLISPVTDLSRPVFVYVFGLYALTHLCIYSLVNTSVIPPLAVCSGFVIFCTTPLAGSLSPVFRVFP